MWVAHIISSPHKKGDGILISSRNMDAAPRFIWDLILKTIYSMLTYSIRYFYKTINYHYQ